MTLRARTTKPASIRTRLRRQLEGEERQQAAVTALFIGLIGLVVLILIGAIALAWYNDNLRPLARVGSVEVGPQLFRNRIALEQWRINTEGNRLTTAQINGEIDQATLSAKTGELEQRREALATTGLDDFVDEIYQSQLAPAEGVNVADADIDARLADELAAPEKRHAYIIEVKPEAGDGEDAAPSIAAQHTALEKAQDALAAIESGRDFADVAREFSTADSAANGGDLGLISKVAAPDQAWAEEVFELDLNGTTPVIRGADGSYRIGKVTEIQAAGEQAGLRDELFNAVPEPQLRDLLRYEVAADQLSDKITQAALTATPNQANLAIIYIEGQFSDEQANADGEVDYSEIVFAPNDDLDIAPELPAEDAAWTKAQQDAQAVFDELNALTGDERKDKFAEIAAAQSDSPTKEDAGAVGFVTSDIPPEAIATELFDKEHQAGDLIGPIRGEAGYYVLQFNEHRDSPEKRVETVKNLLAQPNSDFGAIAREWSDGPEAEDGGQIGWLTEDQLDESLRDTVFALEPGGVSDVVELAGEHYFVKVIDKGTRPLDPDQVPDIRANAFTDWYQPKKDQAKTDGTIVIAGETEDETELEPGSD
jgi:parvulin-like peptidyl-prolyl isomerase